MPSAGVVGPIMRQETAARPDGCMAPRSATAVPLGNRDREGGEFRDAGPAESGEFLYR